MTRPDQVGDPAQDELDLTQEYTVEMPFMPIERRRPSWHLTPFSGKKVPCPKCGLGAGENDSAPAGHYHPNVSTTAPCYALTQQHQDLFQMVGFPEHIDRRCHFCHFEWVEGLAAGAQPAEGEG